MVEYPPHQGHAASHLKSPAAISGECIRWRGHKALRWILHRRASPDRTRCITARCVAPTYLSVAVSHQPAPLQTREGRMTSGYGALLITRAWHHQNTIYSCPWTVSLLKRLTQPAQEERGDHIPLISRFSASKRASWVSSKSLNLQNPRPFEPKGTVQRGEASRKRPVGRTSGSGILAGTRGCARDCSPRT